MYLCLNKLIFSSISQIPAQISHSLKTVSRLSLTVNNSKLFWYVPYEVLPTAEILKC